MEAYKISNKGKMRKNNEDNFLFAPKGCGNQFDNLFIVCDGVGGNNAGEVASRLAVKTFEKHVKKNPLITNIDSGNFKSIYQMTYNEVNKLINDKSKENEKRSKMCTTMLCCTIKDDKAYIANVGDSRIFLITEKTNEDTIERTIDSVTVDNVSIVETEVLPKGSTNVELKSVKTTKRVLTKAVGYRDEIQCDYYEVDLKSKIEHGKKVKFLMCSDGLYDMVSREEILEVVSNKKLKGNAKVKELVKRANNNGGRDNITAILIEL